MMSNDEPALPFYKLQAKPYPIPADLARELAAVVIEWGAFENIIETDLGQLRMFPIVAKLADAMPGAFGAKLKLWKRSIDTLFPTVHLYRRVAEEIYTKSREVALVRHRIIHGLWRHGGDDDPMAFTVLAGLYRPKAAAYFRVDAAFLAMVAGDIKKLSDTAWSLNATRQLHGIQGLLQRQPGPSGEHQAPQPPPTADKP
jgi:hypothetical protein